MKRARTKLCEAQRVAIHFAQNMRIPTQRRLPDPRASPSTSQDGRASSLRLRVQIESAKSGHKSNTKPLHRIVSSRKVTHLNFFSNWILIFDLIGFLIEVIQVTRSATIRLRTTRLFKPSRITRWFSRMSC